MRIGLIGHNSVEYVQKLFEIWNSENSAVLIDYDTPPSVIKQILDECKIEYCFVEESLCRLFENPPPFEIKTYSIQYNMPCFLPPSIRTEFKERYDEKEAVVIYSSGTTGKCKGISLSHRAINNNADSIIDYMKPTVEDRLYLNKKLSHCSSLIRELLLALKYGADILLSPIIVPPRVVFKNILDFNVTILCCNPILIKLYADETERKKGFPASVRSVYSSGDIISEKEIERARSVFGCPVYNVYGQSECGPRITAQTKDCCHGNSAGKPIKNIEVKIDDNGEILVKTNALFSGYTNLNIETREWHRTGDLGYIGTDGELYVTGRTDNMIVIGAHNIYPEAIEKVIMENTDVDDCIVYKKNDTLVCDYIASKKMDIDISRVIKPLLIPYEVPKVYRNVDSISRNRSEKKLRKQ